MTKLVDLPGGGTAVFEDHLTPEEIAERIRSYIEHAEAGLSRSPRASPARVLPRSPMVPPAHTRVDWDPPVPRPQPSWGRTYIERKRAQQREAFIEVYGKHLGRGSVR